MKNWLIVYTLCLIGLNSFSQNIGYDETSPGSKISIHGNLSVGSTYSSVAAPTSGAIIQGSVGIGTSSPSQALDVTGNVSFSQALMPNAAAGTSGQVLQSNGANTAPTWVTPSALTLGQTYNTPVYGTGTTSLTTIGTWVQIAGLTSTITVPANTTLLVTTYGTVSTSGTGGNNGATVDMAIEIDGTAPTGTSNGSIQAVNAICYSSYKGYNPWHITQTYNLSAGSHTIAVYGKLVANNSSTAVVSGGAGTDTQGVLSISFIKQ